MTKAVKGEGPTHTVNLFRGDYAKNQEDPSRGWREERHEVSGDKQPSEGFQFRFFSSQIWNVPLGLIQVLSVPWIPGCER